MNTRRIFPLALLGLLAGCGHYPQMQRLEIELYDQVGRGRFEQAATTQARLLEYAEADYGPESPGMLRMRATIAGTWGLWRRTDKALALVSDALVRSEARYGPGGDPTLGLLYSKAWILVDARRYDEARQVTGHIATLCPHGDAGTRGCLGMLGLSLDHLHLAIGNYREAAAEFLLRVETGILADDRRLSLSALRVLGHWHTIGGLYPEARWLLRRCVDESRVGFEHSSGSRRVWTDASGEISMDVVDSAHAFDSQEPRCLEDLLRVEALAGDGNDARDLVAWRKRLWSQGPDLEKQLIEQARFGWEAWHAVGRTTSDENTLAWYYRGKGRTLDAIATWERADRRLEESLSRYGRHGGEGNAWNHLDILLGLGEAREEVDRLAEAEAAYRRAIWIAESELHPSHTWRLETRAHLAAVLHRRGDLAHAEEHWRRYLAAAGQQRGVDHADYARGLEGLAKTLAESGHPQASFDLQRRASRIHAAYAKRMDAAHGLPLPPALRSPPSLAN